MLAGENIRLCATSSPSLPLEHAVSFARVHAWKRAWFTARSKQLDPLSGNINLNGSNGYVTGKEERAARQSKGGASEHFTRAFSSSFSGEWLITLTVWKLFLFLFFLFFFQARLSLRLSSAGIATTPRISLRSRWRSSGRRCCRYGQRSNRRSHLLATTLIWQGRLEPASPRLHSTRFDSTLSTLENCCFQQQRTET